MLIIPVILLVVLIFAYREFDKNKPDHNDPTITIAPTGTNTGEPTDEMTSEPQTTPLPSPASEPVEGVSGTNDG